MSGKRYVWDRYEADKDAFSDHSSSLSKDLHTANFNISSSPPYPEMYTEGSNANKPFYRGGGSSFTSSGTTKSYSVSSYGRYLYTAVPGDSVLCVVPDVYSDLSGFVWRVGASVSLARESNLQSLTFDTYAPSITKGSYLATVSASSSTALSNGYDGGSYWYVYKGTDDISPSSIYLLDPQIKPGQQSTIVFSVPGVKYGGVYYKVSYSVNGGSYQDLPDTQEKTILFTIPSNTEEIKFRVYSSVTYSYGAVITSGYVYSITYSTNEAPSAPTSVTVPSEVYPEKQFSVTWSPATDPDGNLSGYEIQRAYNGSLSWTHINGTSNTSISTTVERGNQTVQYRVRAYDSKSEYSSWAYSNTATIRNLRAYVGINGKARKVDKIYIGINGKARQVVKGYIGVNGKARKFL